MRQLEAFKQDVKSPMKNQVRSEDILSRQKAGATQSTEDMIKKGVLSKMAQRKMRQEQMASGIVSEASTPGVNPSYGPAAKFDIYNEVDWLKIQVRKAEDDNKRLMNEKALLLQEKTLWYDKFHEENKKWRGMLTDIKVTKAKLNTEISDFAAQRNALRTVEVNTKDRNLYDACMSQLPIPEATGDITSGTKRMKALELHSFLTGLVVTSRCAQAEFTDHLLSMVKEAEEQFLSSLGDGSGANAGPSLQKHQVLVDSIKQWSKHNSDLTAAMINHTSSSNIAPAFSTRDDIAVDDGVVSSMKHVEELADVKASNEELRATIAQLRSKNAELTRAMKERSHRKPSSLRGTSARSGRPKIRSGGHSSSSVVSDSNISDRGDSELAEAVVDAQEESEYEGDLLDDDELLADVPVLSVKEAAEQFSSKYSHIQDLLSVVVPREEDQVDTPEHEKRLARVNTKEFRVILEDELREGAVDSDEFKSLFPTLAQESRATTAVTVTSPGKSQTAQSTGQQLFVSILTDPSNRVFHDALHLYLQDVVLEHPLLTELQDRDPNLGDVIVNILYEDISVIVAQQICDVIVATLSDHDVEVTERSLQNEMRAIQYLRTDILPNQELLNNFITLAIHSITVHPEINALVTLAISFLYEKQQLGAQ